MISLRAFRILVILIIATALIYRLFKPQNKMSPKPKLNVHSFPRPPLLERTPRHLVIKWNGISVAETTDAYWALETTHPPSMPSIACSADMEYAAAHSKQNPFSSNVSILPPTIITFIIGHVNPDTREDIAV